MRYFVSCYFLNGGTYSGHFYSKEDVISFLDEFGDVIDCFSIIEGHVCEDILDYWRNNDWSDKSVR